MTVVPDALMSRSLVLTQAMGSEALKGTHVTLVLRIIVSRVNVGLQVGLLRRLVVTVRALVSYALMYRGNMPV